MFVKLNNNYLNNTDLYIEIVVSKGRGKLTKKAEDMLQLIAKEAIRVRQHNSNEDKKDCYQSALLDMFSNWHNFDEERYTNAFAYFTEIFKRGRAKGMNQLYKKKGDDKVRIISIEGSNDGQGLHSI